MNYTNYKGKVDALDKNTFRASFRSGFTLVEVLTTVLIIGVLVSVSLPMYTRTIERSRATEAMSAIKAMNDSIYAYFTERETCPIHFSQLVTLLPGDITPADEDDPELLSTKFFQFTLGGASVRVPGTDCNGVLATRINGGGYKYTIWHPYTRGSTGKSLSLQCAPVVEDADDNGIAKSRAVCEALGLYRP